VLRSQQSEFERKLFDIGLVSPRAAAFLEDLQERRVLAQTFPEVQALVGFGGGDTGHKDLWGHTKQVVTQTLCRPSLRWAALFHDVGKPHCFVKDPVTEDISFHMHEGVSARLWKKAAARTGWFKPEEISKVHFLIYHLGRVEAYENSWTDSAVRRLREDMGEHMGDLTALARADITTKHSHKREEHHRRLHTLEKRIEALTAIDATPPALPTGLGSRLTEEFGIPPSPALGAIMASLKALVEAGKIERQAPVEVHVAYIKAHLEEFPNVGPK
jgi:poly(A) polymerase